MTRLLLLGPFYTIQTNFMYFFAHDCNFEKKWLGAKWDIPIYPIGYPHVQDLRFFFEKSKVATFIIIQLWYNVLWSFSHYKWAKMRKLSKWNKAENKSFTWFLLPEWCHFVNFLNLSPLLNPSFFHVEWNDIKCGFGVELLNLKAAAVRGEWVHIAFQWLDY